MAQTVISNHSLTIAERIALVDAARGARPTLNGHPAVISGSHEPFATVTRIDNGERYEWSWETAAKIVSYGGAFRS